LGRRGTREIRDRWDRRATKESKDQRATRATKDSKDPKGLTALKGLPGIQGIKGDKGDQGPPGVESRVVKGANGLTVGTVIERTALGATILPDGVYFVRNVNGAHVVMFLPDSSTIQGVCTLSPCDVVGFDASDCSNTLDHQFFPIDPHVGNLFSPSDVYVNSAVVTSFANGHKLVLYPSGPGGRRVIASYLRYADGQCTSGPLPYDADTSPLGFDDLNGFTPPFGVVSVALPAS